MSKVNIRIGGMFFACVTMAFVPFGCASNIEYPPLKEAPISEGPHVPNGTALRFRECVEEYGPELRGAGFEFHVKAKVDAEGRVIDVATDVPHADLAGCVRIATRAMRVPPEYLSPWVAGSLARTSGQAKEARGLVGNVVVLGVTIVLADLIIEAGGITAIIAMSLELTGEVVEAIRKYRPNPNLNRCLDAAAGGEYMWEEFCRAVAEKLPDPYDAQECWGKTSKSEQNKRNWCRNLFGN